ncbi:transposase [Amycolatopsis sp. H20-H5]|uniref:transposase n=1 Tax=Amycolatopsis sp. H20-H5 TaxID=3046309 RepID=UPI003FA3D9BE
MRGPTRSPQGAQSSYKKAADEPSDHAIGRSRGGLTTKIHALTDQREAPVAIRLTAGQAGDNPQLVPLLEDYAESCRAVGEPGRDFRLLGGKAYSHPSSRTALRATKIKHTIPGAHRPDRPAESHRLSRRPATRVRRRALRPAQHRRKEVQPAQATARHRCPLRQVRIDLPRRRSTGLHRHTRPRKDQQIGRHY